MQLFSLIISLAAELAKLARTLVADGMRFIALLARSRTAVAAENLFLRKQLGFYQERKIKPRRFDNVTRFMLVLLSRGFAWQDALANVTPKTFIGWHRAVACFGAGSHGQGVHEYRPNCAHLSVKWL